LRVASEESVGVNIVLHSDATSPRTCPCSGKAKSQPIVPTEQHSVKAITQEGESKEAEGSRGPEIALQKQTHLEHLQQSHNTTLPIRWYWGGPISLSRFIGKDAASAPQYISPNTHMKGGFHISVRENMAEKVVVGMVPMIFGGCISPFL
jgi:hypothetical protein